MAILEYKFSRIHRADDVFIDWAEITLWQGELVPDTSEGATIGATVLQRGGKVDPTTVRDLDARGSRTEDKRLRFTAADFGKIRTNAELGEFCKGYVAKLAGRDTMIRELVDGVLREMVGQYTLLDEQKITARER